MTSDTQLVLKRTRNEAIMKGSNHAAPANPEGAH